MGCQSCGEQNPPGNRFCGSCGSRLTLTCPGCGASNPPTNRFCGECGNSLVSGAGFRVSGDVSPVTRHQSPVTHVPSHLAEKILAARSSLEGERKQVTVLFADVVGSTELIRDLDAEAAQRLLDGAVQRMMDAVHRYEGTVSRAMGDGIMALFGAPIAHEDHAVRACYAALALQSEMARYAEEVRRTYGVRIQARVGLNSGEVVVRLISDDLHMDYTALGQTVHLASRMEQLARPESAALTTETLALVEGYVHVRSLGPVPVKGLPDPIEAYELVGAGALQTRLQVSAARGLTRFVGRQAELDALHSALGRARAGHGQLAALVGEPGVGKSRLVWEVTHSHRTEGWTILESGSVSYGRATSYLPVIDLLRAYCRIEPQDDARAVRERVLGKLLNLDRALEPALPALLSLFDVPVGDPVWERLEPAQRRRQTLDAVKRLLLRESWEQPLLLVFEDLHWIDAETQALLDSLVESLPTARILLLVNFRPEYTHAWGNRGYYTQLRIDPLGQENAGELLASLLGDDPSMQALASLLIERTHGNPFFLEESVRGLIEQGTVSGERGAYRLVGNVARIRVPPTVQAILASRIDRLPPEQKRLLQMAAVVGKDVPLALLQAVAGLTEDELQHGLAQLQLAEFLYEATLFPEPEYTFKHALTHEVAYGSLLQERRRAIHAQLVAAIERVYAARLEEHLEQLAHHARRGDLWEQAFEFGRRAGTRAMNQSANREAVAAFEQALGAVKHLPGSVDTLAATVDLRLRVHRAHAASGQFTQAVEHLGEALAVAEQLGDSQLLMRASMLMPDPLSMLGRHAEGIAHALRSIELAGALGDADSEAVGHCQLGGALHWLGDLDSAIAELRRGLAHLSDDVARWSFAGNAYPALGALQFLGRCLVDKGEFAQGLMWSEKCVVLADEIDRPYQQISACRVHAEHLLDAGRAGEAVPYLRRGFELAEQWSIVRFHKATLALLIRAYAETGQSQLAAPLVEQMLTLASSDRRVRSNLFVIEALVAMREIDAAQMQAVEVVHRAHECQERGNAARATFLLGETVVLSESPNLQEGEAHYREALLVADELGMLPLQARCHLGLGKLFQRADRRDEARTELNTAVRMLHSMKMAYWLPEAETALAEVVR